MALLLTSYKNLGNLLNTTIPHFPHGKMNNCNYLIVVMNKAVIMNKWVVHVKSVTHSTQ